MIPISLKLSNFTSYGTEVPILNFSKFHLAAISGQNGAGKSSLLDSITWCLWGTSRLGDNSDALVRLGQNEMAAEFSFELDGHTYTVKRKRSLKSGGTTSLEFFSGSAGPNSIGAGSPQVHNFTEGTIKATQTKIIETLHLSFETFVNSAFIRQGHADEFTTKGASDRKKILADILGLSHYDLLEEKAKEKAKEIQISLKMLEYQTIEIEAELSQKEAREKALSEAEEEARRAEEYLKEVDHVIKTIEMERESLNLKTKSLLEAKTRVLAAQKELLDLKTQILLKEEALKEHQLILSRQSEIEEQFNKLQNYQERRKALEGKRTGLIKAKDELASLQKEILELEERRSKKVALIQVEIEKYNTQNSQLKKEVNHLLEHKDNCPTCGQTIGEAKNKEIVEKNQKLIQENGIQIKALNGNLEKARSFQLPQQKEALEKEAVIKILEEDTKDYREIFDTINSLSPFEPLYLKLSQAKTAVLAHQETIGDLKKIFQNKESQIKTEQQSLEGLALFEQQAEEVRLKLLSQEQLKQELSQKVLNLRGKAGEARQLVSRATQLEKVMEEKKGQKLKLSADKEAYDELSLAFGKKGIQAMIIETAIPEIEDETNRLLDRLTEGRMRVRLETQRETKGKVSNGEKGIIETLDIVISDEMGDRIYEGLSGGEQFRVNFAIRLALSKLLTHRAGSKLQFLVIDEGFGTQDAEGRSRIVEALNTIKDDFAKIVIITHLEELKEEFPVRIEVQKGPTGSTFEVVGV